MLVLGLLLLQISATGFARQRPACDGRSGRPPPGRIL